MTADDQLIETTSGGLGTSILGLLFLLPGLFVMFAPMIGGDLGSLIFPLPFGGLFAALGLWIAVGRFGTIIDRRARNIVSWWSFLGWRKETTIPWGSQAEILIKKESRGSGKNRRTVYPVQLHGGEKDFEFGAPSTHRQARAQAERVAKFMGFGIRDRSSQDEIFREAGTLDESLLARYKRTGEQKEMPDPIVESRAKLTVGEDSLTFDVGNQGTGLALAVDAIWSAVILYFFTMVGTPILILVADLLDLDISFRTARLPMFALLAMIFVVMVRRRVQARKTSGLLVISSESIKLAGQPDGKEIPLDELEELEVHQAMTVGPWNFGKIVARSDHQVLEYNAGLPRNELEWVRDTLHWFLASLAHSGKR